MRRRPSLRATKNPLNRIAMPNWLHLAGRHANLRPARRLAFNPIPLGFLYQRRI